jgi:hypothetical protein
VFLCKYPALPLRVVGKNRRSLNLTKCFCRLSEKGSTEHGVDVELLAHIAEFISEFGVGLDLIFVTFGEVVEAELEAAVDVFYLSPGSDTMSAFFYI